MQSSGLTVVTAPRLEPLFDRLAGALAADPLPPLQRETILVAQNKGLRAWVTHGLARRTGCAASLHLPAPLTFATDLARRLVPGARSAGDERHPYDAGPLAWRLAPLLDALPDDEAAAPLRAYLDKTGGQTMPLATRLAALLDDYQVYRPDLLAAWAEPAPAQVGGDDPLPDFAHGRWQAGLWRSLRADGTGALDRAAGLAALVDRLRQRDGRGDDRVRDALPPRVAVFGALLFPPLYYRVLAAVAEHVPVTLYAVTAGAAPTAEPHAHPLLRALAGRTRDFWTVLADLDAPAPERLAPPDLAPLDLPSFVEGDSQAVAPMCLAGGSAAATALRQLQAALATDTPPAAPTPLDPADRSVRVHDCHSPTRELEALRDALLDAFAEIPDLRPSDCLVLVPDLATYAPLVDAVFGAESATGDGLRLPVHVVDHPHAPALRVIEAFRRALRLHEGRVTASELLDLLGAPVVRQAAGIREDELPLLRTWAREAGVCWGLSAARKGRFGLPEDDLHTWRFGLDRLLLGVMTGDPHPDAAGDGLVLGHLPCDVAGLGGADLLGRFSEWAEALFSALDAIDRPGTLAEWPDRLLAFLDGAFAAREEEEVEALVFLREKALELALLGDAPSPHDLAARPDVPVSFRTVRAHLDRATATFERREPVLTGRITVADPLVLRHAPHRVVAFLGLGDGVYPRPESAPGFCAIAHAPRPGDAAPRAMEKQLFLDAVLAARDRLILSTVGRSQKDNAERAASVCLDAFLDAAERHWGADARRQLVVRHRLQPFADDYFVPGGPLHSYAGQHRVRTGEAEPLVPFLDVDTPLPGTADTTADVRLVELADAWTNPSRHVVRRRLRLSLDLDDEAVHDDEPVALNALDRFHVRQAVLDGVLGGLDDAALAARIARGGRLPGGAPGAAWLRQARAEAEPVAATVLAWGPTAPLAVDLDVDGLRLAGTLARVGERGALRYRAGKVHGKHLVAAWLDHLALCAVRPGWTCAAGTDDTTCRFEPLAQDDALALLAALVRGYRRAQSRSLPLYEHASKAYVEALSRTSLQDFTARVLNRGAERKPFEPNDGAMKKAGSAFSPWGDVPGDAGDVYVGLATRGREPFVPEEHFAKWALCLWAPLLTHRQPGAPS